jgi:hypothetical protein
MVLYSAELVLLHSSAGYGWQDEIHITVTLNVLTCTHTHTHTHSLILSLPPSRTTFCNNVTICTGHIILLTLVFYICILNMVRTFNHSITLVCPCKYVCTVILVYMKVMHSVILVMDKH